MRLQDKLIRTAMDQGLTEEEARRGAEHLLKTCAQHAHEDGDQQDLDVCIVQAASVVFEGAADALRDPQLSLQQREDIRDAACVQIAPYLPLCRRWEGQDFSFQALASWTAREAQRQGQLDTARRVSAKTLKASGVCAAAGVALGILGVPGGEFLLKAGVLGAAGSAAVHTYAQHRDDIHAAAQQLHERVSSSRLRRKLEENVKDVRAKFGGPRNPKGETA